MAFRNMSPSSHQIMTRNSKPRAELTDRQERVLDEIFKREIWRQGGAINLSGWHQIPEGALKRIARLIGKMRLKHVLRQGALDE